MTLSPVHPLLKIALKTDQRTVDITNLRYVKHSKQSEKFVNWVESKKNKISHRIAIEVQDKNCRNKFNSKQNIFAQNVSLKF